MASSATAGLVYFESWVDPVAERLLVEDGSIDLRRLTHDTPEPESDRVLRGADGYQILPRVELVRPWYADADFIARYPNLLAICSTGSGYDVIDVEACTKAGIIVCNQAGANAQAVAEHAVGLMLGLSKKIASLDRALRRPETVQRTLHPGNNIATKTVGIVGLGHIGRKAAQICREGFGMRVLACDPYLTGEQIREFGAQPVSLQELLIASDFVSVHCPRTDETMGMFGADQFALMQKHAFFINTARGGIHDEDALLQALQTDQIAGAGLDVFLEEPPASDHPLLGRDNVIATPHSAGMTHESLYDLSLAAARQWQDIFAGKAPPRLVNPAAWPVYCRRFQDRFGFAPAAQPAAA